ncbi:MAG TPA: hypothetical protein GX405_09750 [Rhizobiales bacterium]|nr:hypothetical protein [Hyphomicrobiales bacterium]
MNSLLATCTVHPWRVTAMFGAVIVAAIGLGQAPALAQEALVPGQAIVTRFSAPAAGSSAIAIDPKGSVASLVDLRAPGRAPLGSKWADAPERVLATAAEVGLVFGVAFDDQVPANIYLTASSAFGLHRSQDGKDWSAGMWGPGAGPGTVWKLAADHAYRPEIFSEILFEGRANSGPALGDIAYDRWHRQFFVSDLETGIIHRLRLEDGADIGRYDHGLDGRPGFIDAAKGNARSLAPVAFDPASHARTDDCPPPGFERQPACWNFADFRRRVYALGVRRDPTSGAVRLYYSVWGSQDLSEAAAAGLTDPAFVDAGEDARNSIWSIGIGADGDFVLSDVRREILLPDFGSGPSKEPPNGPSGPVADIAFPYFGESPTMLVAERGSFLAGEDAAAPLVRSGAARVLRYRLGSSGTWSPEGRYDVGFAERKSQGAPHIRAAAAGGVDFGPAYDAEYRAEAAGPDQFVWMTGEPLCSPDGPCFDPADGTNTDAGPVSGLQGTPEGLFGEVAPANAFEPYPAQGPVTPDTAPARSYIVGLGDGSFVFGDVEVFRRRPPEIAEGLMPPGWTPPGWTPPPGWAPPTGWSPPPGWMPPAGSASGSGGTAAPGWSEPGWWIIPPGTLPAVPASLDLELTKSMPSPGGIGQGAALSAACTPGMNCRFEIKVVNKGPEPYAGPLGIVDTLPSGWKYASAAAPWSCQQQGPDLLCTEIAAALAPGQSTTLSLDLVPALPDPGDPAKSQNCARIDWKGGAGDDNAANDKDCEEVSVGAAPPDLDITKYGPAECRRGETCQYKVEITNAGGGIFAGPAGFEERNFQHPGLRLDHYTGPSGWTCADTAVGRIVCTNAAAVIEPGASVTVDIAVALPADLPAVLDSLKDCAKIVVAPGDSNAGNDESCAKTALKSEFDLKAQKEGPAVCYEPGPCYFRINVWNAGKGDYEGPLTVTETTRYPAEFEWYKPNPPWQCSQSVGKAAWPVYEVTCKHPWVKLPSAAGIGGMIGLTQMQIRLGLHDTDQKKFENCAKVYYKGGKPDADPANDEACIVTPLDQSGGTLSGGAGERWYFVFSVWGTLACISVQPLGGECTQYTFTMQNTGPSDYSLPMLLRVKFPDGTRVKSAKGQDAAPFCAAEGWTCDVAGTEVSCHPSDCRLGANEKTSVHFEVSLFPEGSPRPTEDTTRTVCGEFEWVPPPDEGIDIEQMGGTRKSRACFTTSIRVGQEPAPTAAPEPAPQATPAPAVDAADLAIVKTGPSVCRAPGRCAFRIEITNKGPNDFVGALRLTDLAPDGWQYRPGSPENQWTCTSEAGKVGCSRQGAVLPAGHSTALELEFSLPPDPGGPTTVDNCALIGDAPAAATGSAAEIRAVQAELNRRGYDAGPVDGKAGRRTRDAIARYQADNQLAVSGRIDVPLVASLLATSAGLPGDPVASNDRACLSLRIEHPAVEKPPVAKKEPERAPVQLKCTGGKVPADGTCVCPPGTVELRGRCVREGQSAPGATQGPIPEPEVIRPVEPQQVQPPPLVIQPLQPGTLRPAEPDLKIIQRELQIICPQGMQWSEGAGKCLPVVD